MSAASECRNVTGFPGYRMWQDGVVESRRVRRSGPLWFALKVSAPTGQASVMLNGPRGKTRRTIRSLMRDVFPELPVLPDGRSK